MPATDLLSFTIKWAGKEYEIELAKSTATKVVDLKMAIEKVTGVAASNQMLLNINKTGKEASDETKLFKLGLQSGHKIILAKSTASDKEAIETSNNVKEEAHATDCVIQAVLGNKIGDYRIEPNHSCNSKNPGVLDPDVYKAQIEQLVKNGDVKMISAPREGKKLLVLDLDHTVFDNDTRAVTKHELIRPYLHEFLTAAYKNYDLMIWSATSMESLEAKLLHYGVAANSKYRIIACFDATTMLKIDVPEHGALGVKPLAVIWGKFPGVFTPKNTLILDDTPRNFLLNPKNGVLIRSFRDAHVTRKEDEELKHFAQYLDEIALVEDLSELDHGNWEEYRYSSRELENATTREQH